MALSNERISEICSDLEQRGDTMRQFARAIEADVRGQDEALIRQLVVALEAMRSEAAARHCGLRICDEAITAARARLDGKP